MGSNNDDYQAASILQSSINKFAKDYSENSKVELAENLSKIYAQRVFNDEEKKQQKI